MYIRPADEEKRPSFPNTRSIHVTKRFKRALDSVRANKVKAAITALMDLHSRCTHYQMRNEEITLNAREQQEIADILMKYGTEPPIVLVLTKRWCHGKTYRVAT